MKLGQVSIFVLVGLLLVAGILVFVFLRGGQSPSHVPIIPLVIVGDVLSTL